MTPQTIGVIGAGLMGHGIAYLLAAAGHTVRIYDPSAEWRNSLTARLNAARELLDGDAALIARISAHDTMAPGCPTAPACANKAAYGMTAFAGKGCTMIRPACRPERPTGSTIIPGTDPPAGLGYDMVLYCTPFFVESTVCSRFNGAFIS